MKRQQLPDGPHVVVLDSGGYVGPWPTARGAVHWACAPAFAGAFAELDRRRGQIRTATPAECAAPKKPWTAECDRGS